MNLSIAAKFGFPAIALAAVLVACPTDTPIVDTTAPQFKSSVPANDTTAIAANVAIKIVFDEAMNKTATQGAVTFSPAVTPASFVWGNGDKELTINPPAAGWGTAASYTVTIGAGAKDVAGNSFVAVPSKTFKFKATPPSTGGNVNATLNAANTSGYFKTNIDSVVKIGSNVGMRVGYTVAVGGAPDGIAKAFVGFTLPAGTTASKITSAKLTLFTVPTASEGASGDGTNLFAAGRTLNLESIALVGSTLGVGDFPTIGTAAGTVTSAAGLANIDVTTAVKAAVATGKVQFSLSMVAPATTPAAGYWLRVGGGGAATASQPTLVLNVAP